MRKPRTIASDQLPPGVVRREGAWAVGNRDGELFAVSRRCRHQLADLSAGSIDADGCLVCPWHQSTYDVSTGAMVEGPSGFLGFHRHVEAYARFVRSYSRVLRLRVLPVSRRGDQVVLGEEDHAG